MDFYWHYSGKETVDIHGKENFCRAIGVAKQVFNTLTEYIQVYYNTRLISKKIGSFIFRLLSSIR